MTDALRTRIIQLRREGLGYTAIGKELGVTSGLVSKWKERARKWLWDAYQKEYGDEG